MPYVGGKLAPWFGSAPVIHACVKMAEDGGKSMRDSIRTFTPVDTGELRESIHTGGVGLGSSDLGHGAYSVEVSTSVSYAEYVERGTGLWGPFHQVYTIRPKDPNGWLRFKGRNGEYVFAKSVTQKGSEGAHMFVKGAAATEAAIDRIVAPALAAWAFEQEHSNPWAA